MIINRAQNLTKLALDHDTIFNALESYTIDLVRARNDVQDFTNNEFLNGKPLVEAPVDV